ncbi:phosphopantetheine-binding protein [Clostridium sp.]|uniref:phosphopantetheine-binding protein n=1 Tax=Clostridium sp. TaxID=1506 RepID=UPI0025BACB4F|nr:phosphopantetheine-binding protein [Clostridium sp.]MCI9303725.1 hypothetical protein [Clostridium sp.]
MDIKNNIIQIFKDNAIEVNEENLEETIDMDSLTFISILMEIEDFFSIEIENEKLLVEEFNSILAFENIISKYL